MQLCPLIIHLFFSRLHCKHVLLYLGNSCDSPFLLSSVSDGAIQGRIQRDAHVQIRTKPVKKHENLCFIYLFIYLFIYCGQHLSIAINYVERSPCLEASNRSDKKCSAFYRIRRFGAFFTRTRHWPLFSARWIQSTRFHTISVRSTLIFFPSISRSSEWSLQTFPPKCMNFWTLPCVLHAPTILSSLVWPDK